MRLQSIGYETVIGLLVVAGLTLSFTWISLTVEFPYHEDDPGKREEQAVMFRRFIALARERKLKLANP